MKPFWVEYQKNEELKMNFQNILKQEKAKN